jgi:hypothetical protein
LAVTTLGR